jgi:hypothetical protein
LIKSEFYESVITPESLVKIGKDAFKGTKFYEKPDPEGLIYVDKWLVGGAATMTVTSITLSSDTVGIADYAFANNESLKLLTIPNKNSLRYIGRGAFCRASKLDMVDLSMTNVRRIEDYTFYACTSISQIKLPRLTSVGRAAFYNCMQITKLDFSNGKLESIGDRAFNGCINLEEVNLGDSLKTIGMGAFYSCQKLTSISLPNTLTSISDYAFFACYSLTQISLSTRIESVGNYAFAHCVALERISFGNDVKSIGDYAFYACEVLKLVSFNEGLESIGDYAFLGTISLTSLKLPSTLVSVGDYAFAYTEKVQNIVLADTIESVGAHVFYACNALTVYVTSDKIPETWSEGWNSSFRPVILGCTLSENGEYIVSVVIGENTLDNVWAPEEIALPERLGYNFLGWATEVDGEVVYTMAEISNAPEGVTLYAVWDEL